MYQNLIMTDYHNLYHKINSINNLEPFHILISNEKEKNTTLFLKYRFYQFFQQRISSLFWC